MRYLGSTLFELLRWWKAGCSTVGLAICSLVSERRQEFMVVCIELRKANGKEGSCFLYQFKEVRVFE